MFLGLNEETGELLAIKEVDCCRASEDAIAQLEIEIATLQLLRHPNIVAYYGLCVRASFNVYVHACSCV